MLILLGGLNLRATFRAVENSAPKTITIPSTSTPIFTAIMCTATPMATTPRAMVTPKKPFRRRSSIAGLAVRNFIRLLRPLVIGTVHGLAGSAAVALLVLPIIHDPVWAMAYLLIFGVGTIAGMMLITAAIAVPVSYSTRFQFLHRHLGTAAGVLSLGFGLFLVYQIGYVDGLFVTVKPGCNDPGGNMNRKRVRIVVRGAVQGVGFRPFVYRLAKELELTGWVVNSAQGVFIEIEGASDRVLSFTRRLKTEKPARAIIQSCESSHLDPLGYEKIRNPGEHRSWRKKRPHLAGHRDLRRLSARDF